MTIPQLTEEQLLKNLEIKTLNAMQAEVVARSESGGDLILLAPTGSGKTLSFLIPLYYRLNKETKGIQALIITPSRELALQTEDVFKKMKTGFKVNTCYGGHDIHTEENNLSTPPSLIIGTPGRLLDHLKKGNIALNQTRFLVLDEFDKCLEMGFQDDMAAILKWLPSKNTKFLISATEAIQIPPFVSLQNPHRINYIGNIETKLGIKAVRAGEKEEKLDLLFKLACLYGHESTLVFCNQRETVEVVCEYLSAHKIVNSHFHGGMEQHHRESALSRFRNGSINILVTTDLGARGLDIPEVKNVIHFQLPPKQDTFIHRNGRTARMTATGTAFLLLSKGDTLPEYLEKQPETVELKGPFRNPSKPVWETLYIGAGKKDKVNKVDVAGFLMKQGSLLKDEVGLIEIKDDCAYVAVKRDKVKEILQKVTMEKIKNKKVKIEIAREAPLGMTRNRK